MAEVLHPRGLFTAGGIAGANSGPIARGKARVTGLARVVSVYFCRGALTGCTEPHVTIAVP